MLVLCTMHLLLLCTMNQQTHNYFTNYHTATCFDTIVSSRYVSGQHDSIIYMQSVHTASTQTDFMITVAT